MPHTFILDSIEETVVSEISVTDLDHSYPNPVNETDSTYKVTGCNCNSDACECCSALLQKIDLNRKLKNQIKILENQVNKSKALVPRKVQYLLLVNIQG
jgi:hypothetical protein